MRAARVSFRALLAMSLLGCVARPVAAQRTLVIQDFQTDLRVDSDGTLHVLEHLRPRFSGAWNGIYRIIPIKAQDPLGGTRRLRIDDLSASDGSGTALKVERSYSGDALRLKIYVPDARDAVRDVVLRYTVANALIFHDAKDGQPAFDELYWNATGNFWEVPIEHATARVLLPTGITGLRTEAHSGAYGSTASDVDVRAYATAVEYTARNRLEPGEGLTVAAAWDPGVIARPTAADRLDTRFRTDWPLALPVLAFGFMFLLWRRYGDDPETGPVVVRYQPPAGLSPAEVGYVDREATSARDVTATIVDLAVRGHISIEEVESSRFLGLGEKTDYEFVARTDPSQWLDLQPHEREILTGLFDEGRTRTRMDDLKGEFYKSAQEARKRIEKAVLNRKLYGHSPVKVRSGFVFLGVALGAVVTTAGVALASRHGLNPVPAVVGGIATGLVVLVFGLIMPRRTGAGAIARSQTRGFKEFLSRVESDRYDRMMLKPEMFDQFLPFAMALGVEDRWAKRFEGITLPPPDWYHGVSPVTTFNASAFVSSLNGATAAMGSAMSPPSGSGSSGVGGGGFSGGGFGGGGGGGF